MKWVLLCVQKWHGIHRVSLPPSTNECGVRWFLECCSLSRFYAASLRSYAALQAFGASTLPSVRFHHRRICTAYRLYRRIGVSSNRNFLSLSPIGISISWNALNLRNSGRKAHTSSPGRHARHVEEDMVVVDVVVEVVMVVVIDGDYLLLLLLINGC